MPILTLLKGPLTVMSWIKTLLKWIVANRKSLFKAIVGLSVGFLLAWGTTLSRQNKKLSESLIMALNNIEAYLGIINDSLLANNVLRLDMEELHQQNDKVLLKLDEVRKELKIKADQITTAATQTLILYVNDGKPIDGDLTQILKDTIYHDTMKYNDLTTVEYTIGKDTVNITLDVRNTQYLYIYSKKEYKHKKNFIKRLLTLDFKKVKKYKYEIVNTNDLLKTLDVRIIESDNK